MSQEHIVVCGDGAALGFGFFCQRMVVDGHVLIFICLDNHDHRQVSNQQRKQGGEHDHGAGKALAQGNASQRTVQAYYARARCHFGAQARALIACAQQEAQDDEARQERGTALAYKRKGKASKGDKARYAAHDDECLQHDNGSEAYCHKRANVALCANGNQNAADGEAQVQKQHTCSTQKTRFFGYGAKDEVGFNNRNLLGHAIADAHAEQAAVCDAEDRLDQLIARVGGIRKGVEPCIDANLNMAEQEVHEHEAHGNHQKADNDVGVLSGGHVEHCDEHEEQDQSRAQVLFEYDNQQGHGPHDDDGNQRTHVGYTEGPQLVIEDGKHLAVLCQVCCQEDDDTDFCKLTRLNRETTDGKPNARTVDFVTDNWKHGRHQQQDAGDHNGVFVAAKLVEILHECQDEHHEHHAKEQPSNLFHSQVRCKARDEGNANA